MQAIRTENTTGNIPELTKVLKPSLSDPNRVIKQAIWAYFFLLILEGALRKWFLPGLATPILVIRDPVALWLVYIVWKRSLLPANIYIVFMVLIAITGIYTATLIGHGNIWVAIFGARILLIHFPLMFVIGRIFTREDVIKMGKYILWISIPMTFLIALQFYSPQDAWVNRGIGGDMDGAGFDGALGYFRPPGTFSFTTGTTLFYSLASCFVIYYWFNPQNINRLLLISATISLLVAIPLSISRALLFQVGLSLIFAFLSLSKNPKFLAQIILICLIGILSVFILSQISMFQIATGAFTSRFDAASVSEGGLQGTIVNRFLGGLLESVTDFPDLPIFGYGLGMGTNVGSTLLMGDRSFLIAEGEWARIVGEMGIILGLAIIILRISFVINLLKNSFLKLSEEDLLPWILLSYGFLLIMQGQWAQPTSLGFSTLLGGLILASLRNAPNTDSIPTDPFFKIGKSDE